MHYSKRAAASHLHAQNMHKLIKYEKKSIKKKYLSINFLEKLPGKIIFLINIIDEEYFPPLISHE